MSDIDTTAAWISVTDVGAVAQCKRSYRDTFAPISGQVITDYIEEWQGNRFDAHWPSYKVSDSLNAFFGNKSLGLLKCYAVEAGSAVNGPISALTARFSNRFDYTKAIPRIDWRMEQVDLAQNVSGGSIIVIVFNHVDLFFPVVTNESYYLTPPTLSSPPIVESPTMPAGLPTPVPAIIPYNFTWLKTMDGLELTPEGWKRTEVWDYRWNPLGP